jgi:hypothetical protein
VDSVAENNVYAGVAAAIVVGVSAAVGLDMARWISCWSRARSTALRDGRRIHADEETGVGNSPYGNRLAAHKLGEALVDECRFGPGTHFEVLLSNGAPINVPGTDGVSALGQALDGWNTSRVAALVQGGAEVTGAHIRRAFFSECQDHLEALLTPLNVENRHALLEHIHGDDIRSTLYRDRLTTLAAALQHAAPQTLQAWFDAPSNDKDRTVWENVMRSPMSEVGILFTRARERMARADGLKD